MMMDYSQASDRVVVEIVTQGMAVDNPGTAGINTKTVEEDGLSGS